MSMAFEQCARVKNQNANWKFVISLLSLFLFFVSNVKAQVKVESNKYRSSRDFLPASPTASMLGAFGNTPVSPFTGTPEVNIPLYTLRFKDLAVDLNLLYHQALGNKPDAFPGFTGNGWLLNSGGVITRISKGVRPYDFPDPQNVPNNFNPTASSTWSSQTAMNGYIAGPDMFVDFNSRYDEFSYVFGGFSGKFYTDHVDTLRIKTAQGEELFIQKEISSFKKIKIPYETQSADTRLQTSGQYRDTIYARDFVYKFTVTDSRGIKYIFGGSDSAIEFSRPGMDYNTFDLAEKNTIPTSWFLTSIESPNGYKISFVYSRGKFFVTNEIGVNGLKMLHTNSQMSGLPTTQPLKVIKSTMYHPCYLEKVITPYSTTQFYWSIADQQLRYRFDAPNPLVSESPSNWLPDDINSQYYFCKYVDVRNASIKNRFPNKLDSFIVKGNDSTINKTVAFTYTSDTTTRLKLTNLKIKGPLNSTSGFLQYKFSYDTQALPDYLSFKTDWYGFYNGRNDYITSTSPNYYVSLFENSTQRQAYIDSRAPDTTYTQAEILKKVVYPTGGSTVYEYENNRYGRVAEFWPSSITENLSNTTILTGGLRIKKITSYDYSNRVASEKRYFYVKDYASGGQLSSGVLSYKPKYYLPSNGVAFNGSISAPASNQANASKYTGTFTYQQYGTDPVNVSSINRGTHITYSEVTEVNADGGYTVFKYKNYDNGYHDRAAENIVVDNSNVEGFWKEDDANLMDLERGQALSTYKYDNANTLKEKNIYEYDTTSARFNKNVRLLKAIANPIFCADIPSFRYVATLLYTYYPFVQKETKVEYSGSDSLITSVEYQYDNKYRVPKEQKITGSDGIVKKEQTIYAADKVAGGTTSPYSTMVQRFMVGLPVENMQINSSQVLTKQLTPFSQSLSSNSSLILPASVQSQFKTDAVETRVNFLKYDSAGNVLAIMQLGGVKTCYLWSYARAYAIAKIVNAEYDTIVNVLGGTAIDDFARMSNPTAAQVTNFTDFLRVDSRLSNAMITTYTYDPLVGVTSESDPNGKTTSYIYDDMGRLQMIKDQNGYIIKQFCYNYAGQPTTCVLNETAARKTFVYNSDKATLCDANWTPTTIHLVTAYSKAGFGRPGGGIDDIYYYSDPQVTNLLSTGYYADSSRISGNLLATYRYIVNGRLIYTNMCGNADPIIAEYSDTLVSTMCTTTLPVAAIFISGLPQRYYADYLYTTPVKDGYYKYNGAYYKVVNGYVTSTTSCSTVSNITMYRHSCIKSACSSLSSYNVYYAGSLGVNTILYTNSAMTVKLGPGHYKYGSNVYTVDNNLGKVTGVRTCSYIASTPTILLPPCL